MIEARGKRGQDPLNQMPKMRRICASDKSRAKKWGKISCFEIFDNPDAGFRGLFI